METKPKHFLTWWFATLTALVLAVGTFNVIVDPYRVFRMPPVEGFNARKGAAVSQEWLYKAYESSRIAPRTVLLGSSRVALGMDAHSSHWPPDELPIYNLGIGGAMPYASFRYLQNLTATGAPARVVVGLDFEYFLDTPDSEHTAAGDFESRLANNADGSPNRGAGRQRLLDLVQLTLSYGSLSDSIATVIGNLRGDPADTAGGNQPDEEMLRARLATGTFPVMEWSDVMSVRRFTGGRNPVAMADLRSILDLCQSRGTQVVLYIHPMPADTLEMLDLLGYWPTFEDWKRELLGLVSRYPRPPAPGGVALWDFSDYDAYSTETVRPDGRVLRWFWESWHYTRALGDRIIERIHNTGDAHFGNTLTAETIESHLAEIRLRRQLYRVSHQADINRVRSVYEAAIRPLTSPAMAARNPGTTQR